MGEGEGSAGLIWRPVDLSVGATKIAIVNGKRDKDTGELLIDTHESELHEWHVRLQGSNTLEIWENRKWGFPSKR